MSDAAGVVDFEKCKVADLKRMLKERGLSITGIKSELISRLQADEAAGENGAEDVVADEDDLLQDEEVAEVEDEDEEVEEVAEEKEKEETPAEEPSEEEPTPKKIKLTAPVLPSSTTVTKPSATEDDDAEKKEEKTVEEEDGEQKEMENMTPEESAGMLAKRAERFGVKSEDAKKLARAQRFGLPITAAKSSSSLSSLSSSNGKAGTAKVTSSAPPTSEELEKLKKRAERFGTVVSQPLSQAAEKERAVKRKERFGISTSSAGTPPAVSSQELDEKKRRRLERFGNVK